MESFEAAAQKMPEVLAVLFSAMKAKLAESNISEGDTVQQIITNITTVRMFIFNLQEYVKENQFESEADEIFFFKYIKPLFYSELIFYIELLTIETQLPLSAAEGHQLYYQSVLNRIIHHYADHQELYAYLRLGDDSQDNFLFLRKNYHPYYTKEHYYIDADPTFYTHGDFRVANILAHDKLQTYLTGAIENANNPCSPSSNIYELAKGLEWTDSKTDAVELLTAIYAKRSVSGGKATFKQLVTVFEVLFNIDLGHYNDTKQQLKRRKKSPTTYLDGLTTAYIRYMNEDDPDAA